ncbi:heparinase II/III domain-containing protein [Rothia halotolerans]|uniref:heparinase II/III domain-containing protein n=1 Tax=Rothia halotolerans TaxID=405770 RepID=UPI00101C9506|nr:heparinase II/III family protein [Rothia halotolerans]
MDDLFPNLTEQTVSPSVETSRHTGPVAKKAMDGFIIPFPGYPQVEFGESFDWGHEEPGLTTTYQLYLQNLRVVNELLNEYQRSGDVEFVDKATELVFSWLEYVDDGNSVAMTWYDHAIASRVRTLIYYAYVCRLAEVAIDEERIAQSIRQHAELLMLDENHRMNNHGIMVDWALICSGFVLGNESYVLNGLGRVRSIFWQTFSPRGVHQENSPEYHRMVSGMFRSLEEYLGENGATLGGDIVESLDNIDRYPAIIAKPDRKLPALGDSSSGISSPRILWGNFHDELSGTSVMKHKDSGFYLAFISGFSQTAHKHSDDLSVILSSGGVDFFVDAGKYNYGNNKFRRYVVSSKAHSSFSLNRGYIKTPDNKITRKIATDHFLDSKSFTVASGYNAGYEGAILRRTVYYLPAEGLTLIRDHGRSDRSDERWFERFNLHQDVAIEAMGSNEYMLSRAGASLNLKYLYDADVKIIQGNTKSKWPSALNSPASGKVVPTSQVVASRDGGHEFRGSIALSAGQPRTVEEHSEMGVLHLRVDGQEYHLPEFDLHPSEMFAEDVAGR